MTTSDHSPAAQKQRLRIPTRARRDAIPATDRDACSTAQARINALQEELKRYKLLQGDIVTEDAETAMD